MMPFSVSFVRCAGQQNLVGIEADDRDTRGVEEQVEFAEPGGALAGMNHDGGFEAGDCARQTFRVAGDGPGEVLRFRLPKEDGQKDRRINHHQRKAP